MKGLDEFFSDARITIRKNGNPAPDGCCVVYWMQRAQRGIDNPALDLAIRIANKLQQPVAVFFGLHPGYPHGNLRHYSFLFDGLEETARRIERRGAAFVFRPYPDHDLIRFCHEVRASLVIGDENPMREPEGWRKSAAHKLSVPFYTVDADVIVPTKLFPKEEYAARTMRPKIHKHLLNYLVPCENNKARFRWAKKNKPVGTQKIEKSVLDSLPLNRSAQPVARLRGGTQQGLRLLHQFIKSSLTRYDQDRNFPELSGTSGLSPYLHFGQLSPLTIALTIGEADAPVEAKNAYLEELIVRRELAINFVARNPRYDSLEGCPEWGQKTLAESAADFRDVLYTERQLENAETHDDLWNAAQMEMVKSGRMHGYLRMYWAKKILEWTRTPSEAFAIAVQLNDRYFIDGRDPNGYTGIAWAIGGKHDRPWGPRRPIFGLIRYMSYEGCKRKFDIKSYLNKVSSL